MNKILYHTITFKVPEDQVYKSPKTGKLLIAPTLTKTYRVTKRLGLPSIIFKSDEHILHPVIENKGTINTDKNKINFHTITVKVPVDQVYKSPKTGKLLIAPTLTKINNLTSRQKKLSLILENDKHILHPEITNNGTVEIYTKSTRQKPAPKKHVQPPIPAPEPEPEPKLKKEKYFLSDITFNRTAGEEKELDKFQVQAYNKLFELVNEQYTINEMIDFFKKINIRADVYERIDGFFNNNKYTKNFNYIEFVEFIYKLLVNYINYKYTYDENKIKLMLCSLYIVRKFPLFYNYFTGFKNGLSNKSQINHYTVMRCFLIHEDIREELKKLSPEIKKIIDEIIKEPSGSDSEPEPAVLPMPEPAPKNIEPVVYDLRKKIMKFESIGRNKGASAYNGDTFIQGVLYIALLLEYERKCAIIESNLTDIRINASLKSPMNKDFFNTAETLSNDILDCIKRGEKIIGIPLGLRFGTSRIGHANMLIYRVDDKTIERFEPHGKEYQQGGHDDDTFNKILNEMFEVKMKPYLKQYTPKFSKPADICPNPLGFQTLEGSIKGLSKEGGGFCGLWSLFILELMFINPTKSTKEILKLAFDITKGEPEYLKNVIRGYVVKSEKLLDDYIKKINSTGTFNYSTHYQFHTHKNIIQNNLLSLLVSWKSESSLLKSLKNEEIKANENDNKYKKLIDLLETKSKSEINLMLSYLYKGTISKKKSVEEMIKIIIYLLENKNKRGQFTQDKIFKFFVIGGAGIKICPKVGKCKIVSKCGGVRT